MKKIKNYKDFLLENNSIKIEMPLPYDIINISNQYIKNGKNIFVVGGAVRDFLQGKTPKDYDLVTNALPSESKKILNEFNVSDEQGKNFGVIRVYTKDEPNGYEIASYRKDISMGRDTKGNDQKVEMGNHITIEDDCMRRDLTINALFYNIEKKEIVDIVGGVNDIKNNVIKAVGNPIERFKEDRLRICRIFRFTARSNGKIDKQTSDAIKSDNRLIGVGPKEDVSAERIWDEVKKSFAQCKNFSIYLTLLNEYNMWPQILPGVNINEDIKDSKFLEVYLSNILINNNPDKLLNKLVQEFKIEVDMARKVVFLILLINLNINNVIELYKKKQVAIVSDDVILDWYKINGITDKVHMAFMKYKPSVDSKELMDKGLQGAQLGAEIKRLEIEKFKQML
jgi:tRNA nucleotidyltransferase/poly(A) polymerase